MTDYFPVTHSILSVSALTTELLQLYSLPSIISFRFLQQGLNDTYGITVAGGEKYILRIYRAGWRSWSDISYEIDALKYLSSQGIAVSKALPMNDGKFIRTFSAPEGTRYAVLFTYAPGNELSYKRDIERMAFNYGKAAARIHNAMQDFASQHVRFPLDLEYLLDTPLKVIGPVLSYRADDWAYLQELAGKICNWLTELPSDALEQGFCHGDFNGGNAHIASDGTVTFFDFDGCGWGWRAYDLAVFRWLARINGQEQERWQPFLRGYSEEKKLNEIDLQAIPLFIAIRNIWILGLHIGNGHDWGFGWLNDKHYDVVIQSLHDWEAEYFAGLGVNCS